mmetsp:Transcript_27075/g.72930  ORF Transcript_27075/g.72930 Transcript_27075/m.72930 type:complete len:234 (-) Transcript_27075:89-790(-)
MWLLWKSRFNIKDGKCHLEGQGLAKVPNEVYSSNQKQPVTELWLQQNALTVLGPRAAELAALELLYVNDNPAFDWDGEAASTDLEETAAQWTRLQELNLSKTSIQRLPSSAAVWTDLRQLYLCDLPQLSGESLALLPPFPRLRVLMLHNCPLVEGIAESWSSMVELKQVSLCSNPNLCALPSGMGAWAQCEKLFLNDNPSLRTLPDSLGARSFRVALTTSAKYHWHPFQNHAH